MATEGLRRAAQSRIGQSEPSREFVRRDCAGQPAKQLRAIAATDRVRANGDKASLETRLLLGALAGMVGTAAMTAAMRALHRRLPPQQRYPLPPREIIQKVLPEPAERGLTEEHRQSLTMAGHFGYGAATAALYAAAGAPASAGLGALYGVLVWGGSYLGWIPGMRILEPATRHPAQRNGLMIACHLVWGTTMATTLRELQRANVEIFAGNVTRDAQPDGWHSAALERAPEPPHAH
jgi:uncharacterized membrane protein YagU involved in acid resistance